MPLSIDEFITHTKKTQGSSVKCWVHCDKIKTVKSKDQRDPASATHILQEFSDLCCISYILCFKHHICVRFMISIKFYYVQTAKVNSKDVGCSDKTLSTMTNFRPFYKF